MSYSEADTYTCLDVVQINGGSIEEKVDYAYGLFEKPVKVTDIFEQDEMIDTIAITKGRGTEGVVTRWGVSRLPRKTHRGLRKVRSSSVLHVPLLSHYYPGSQQTCLPQGSPVSDVSPCERTCARMEQKGLDCRVGCVVQGSTQVLMRLRS